MAKQTKETHIKNIFENVSENEHLGGEDTQYIYELSSKHPSIDFSKQVGEGWAVVWKTAGRGRKFYFVSEDGTEVAFPWIPCVYPPRKEKATSTANTTLAGGDNGWAKPEAEASNKNDSEETENSEEEADVVI